ncbi:tetratricopeptide repeat protein [Bacteroidota bacterium]
MSQDKFITCQVCGGENKAGSSFCNECGAKLLDNKKIVKQNNSKTGKKRKSAKSGEAAAKSKSKVISNGKLFYIITALVLIGLLNLFSAGVFDSPTYVGSTVQNNTADPHQGVDLSSLQEINNLQDRVKNNPGDHQSILKLAHLRNDSGFYEDAIKDYQSYLKLRPFEADVIVDMGVCYYQLNDFENAIATMKQALKLNSKHQIAHFNIGIVNFASGNKEEAISWWKKTVELDASTNIAKKAKELINTHQ